VPNRWIRFVILDEWQFDAPTACPCCPDEGRVTLDCVQNSCGSIQTVGISVDVGSLTAAGAKLLALALDGAANVLHTFKKQITPCNCGCITYIGECER
jgi:hypothetical protein